METKASEQKMVFLLDDAPFSTTKLRSGKEREEKKASLVGRAKKKNMGQFFHHCHKSWGVWRQRIESGFSVARGKMRVVVGAHPYIIFIGP